MEIKKGDLTRKVNKVPRYIEDALEESSTKSQFLLRPAYQQNDYISWIVRAKRLETREKRLNQMLSELKSGDKYMNMAYKAKK